MNVYSHGTYLSLLHSLIEENSSSAGFRSKLAKAAGMHLPYLTRVMKGEIHLTADHAAGIAEYLNLSEPDTSYFLALVMHDRAGTPRLRRILASQLKALRLANDRGGRPKVAPASADVTTEFCSDWVLSAIYAALRIPSLCTEVALAKHFRLPPATVGAALARLAGIGLLGRGGSQWKLVDGPDLYIDGRSWQGQLHTRNWRSQLAARRAPLLEDEMTFTSTFAVAGADIPGIRRVLRDALNEVQQIVEPSKPEEVALLAVDFTRI